MSVSRADTSVLGRWWWTIDRWTLAALLALVGFGYLMMLAASPAVAERIGASSRNMFIIKQVFYLALAAAVMVAVSLLPPKGVLRLALLGGLGALALTAATLLMGTEIKGARRWISLPGLSLQPSEFLKPCFAVVVAWLLAEGQRLAQLQAAAPNRGTALGRAVQRGFFPAVALGLFAIIALLLKSQPDIGMLLVIAAVFLAQFFVAGLNLLIIGTLAGLAVAGGIGAYFTLPHVRSRVDRFLHPDAVTPGVADNHQTRTAEWAFGNGGLFGRGPGEGHLKNILPDAHADFVFAVAGEEFGLIVCMIILGLFAFVVVRGLLRLLAETDSFAMLAATGLLTQFGLQAFINMASTLHLIPTKGMTLPFVSYGGSSVVAIALGMGMLLALTRRRLSRLEGLT